jgi:hypothetical protein
VKRILWWSANGLLVALLLLLAYMGVRAAPAVEALFDRGSGPGFVAAVALAGLIYFASHIVRIARLALIASDARLSLRLLTRVHLFTSGVGLALPFKLGDAYRAGELALATGSAVRGISLVYVERLFDVAVILLLLAIAVGFGLADSSAYGPVLIASLIFVSFTALVLVLVPDNLRRISSYVIRRYDQEWTVVLLRRITEIRGVLANTAAMLNGRYGSLFVLTALIWVLEAMALAVLLGILSPNVEPLGAVLTFLSSITEGTTLLDRLDPQAVQQLSGAMLAYLAATQIPLLLVGFVAGLQLGAGRLTGGFTGRAPLRSRTA